MLLAGGAALGSFRAFFLGSSCPAAASASRDRALWTGVGAQLKVPAERTTCFCSDEEVGASAQQQRQQAGTSSAAPSSACRATLQGLRNRRGGAQEAGSELARRVARSGRAGWKKQANHNSQPLLKDSGLDLWDQRLLSRVPTNQSPAIRSPGPLSFPSKQLILSSPCCTTSHRAELRPFKRNLKGFVEAAVVGWLVIWFPAGISQVIRDR